MTQLKVFIMVIFSCLVMESKFSNLFIASASAIFNSAKESLPSSWQILESKIARCRDREMAVDGTTVLNYTGNIKFDNSKLYHSHHELSKKIGPDSKTAKFSNEALSGIWLLLLIAVILTSTLAAKTSNKRGCMEIAWLISALILIRQKCVLSGTYGGSGDDRGYDLVAIPSGGSYMVGYHYLSSKFQMWIFKFDSDNSRSWDREVTYAGNAYGFSADVTSDSGCLAAGSAKCSSCSERPFLAKYSSSGTFKWSKVVTEIGTQALKAITLSSGDFFMVGMGTASAFYAKLLNSDQSVSFSGSYSSATHFTGVDEFSDGSLAVVGHNNKLSCVYVRYSSTGTKIDETTGIQGGSSYTVCNYTTIAPDGNVVIAGSTYPGTNGNWDAIAIKLTPNGTFLWQKMYGTSYEDYARSVRSFSSQYLLFGGSVNSGGTDWNMWIFITDLDGNSLWSKPYVTNSYQEGLAACMTNSNDVAIGGFQRSSGNNDAYITFISACPPGKYENSGSCSTCNTGRANPNFGASSCTSCTPGYYQNGATPLACQPCQPGTYQSNSGRSSCSTCSSGLTSGLAATSCTANSCAAGSYKNPSNPSTCLLCDPGTYQNTAGQSSCLACPLGKISTSSGATSCTSCGAGTYQNGSTPTACQSCEPGTYQSSSGASSCTSTVGGQYQNLYGETTYKSCTAGTYQDLTKQTSCKNCSIGTSQSQTGRSSCTSCSAGTYQDQQGQSSCLNCLAGYYQDLTGQTSCKGCQIGYYQDLAAQSTCKVCDFGTYQDIVNQTSCKSCLVGNYQNETGKTSCKLCPQGSYQNVVGQAACTLCGAGTYQDEIGKTICKNCQPGFYQNSAGKTTCKKCSAGYYQDLYAQDRCKPCDPGYYQDANQGSSCKPCSPGYYQNEAASSSCKLCPNGTFQSSSGGTSCFSCYPLCQSCHGSDKTDCSLCLDDVPNLLNEAGVVCDCIEGFFYDSSQTDHSLYCQPCSDYCGTCSSSTECIACVDSNGVTLDNGVCSCSVPGYMVITNSTTGIKECVTCNPICLTCTGPGINQCQSCDLTKHAIFVSPSTCKCLEHFYYDSVLDQCTDCHSFCTECTGPSAYSCVGCDTNVSLSLADKPSWCVQDCPAGYYKNGTVCESTIFDRFMKF